MVFVAVELPLLHKYVYGAVPPEVPTVAEPVDPPLQLTLVLEEIEADKAVGSVTIVEAIMVHPVVSLMVTV